MQKNQILTVISIFSKNRKSPLEKTIPHNFKMFCLMLKKKYKKNN